MANAAAIRELARTYGSVKDWLSTTAGLPWAPITRPEDLLHDPHLLGSGGLQPMRLPDGRATLTPLLPLSWNATACPGASILRGSGNTPSRFSRAPAWAPAKSTN